MEEHRGDLAVVHDRDPVADELQLLQFGGGDEHRHTAGGGSFDQLVDLGFRADVDAAGGLVEQQQLRSRREGAAEDRPLLVAA